MILQECSSKLRWCLRFGSHPLSRKACIVPTRGLTMQPHALSMEPIKDGHVNAYKVQLASLRWTQGSIADEKITIICHLHHC